MHHQMTSSKDLVALEALVDPGTFGDRRRRIVDGSEDHNRFIIRCIGKIVNSKRGSGTGTIIDYDRNTGTFIVATCAHVVCKRNGSKSLTLYKNKDIVFSLVQTKEDTSQVLQSFTVLNHKIHPKYDHCDTSDKYDLALLFVWDRNHYCEQHIFTENQLPQDVISLQNCKEIEDRYKGTGLNYELYGFPGNQSDHSIVINGGMYGMSGFAELNDEETFYGYKGIDTEGGQSGSSLFVKLPDESHGKGDHNDMDAHGQQETIAIVGIHTLGGGDGDPNHAVALNEENFAWMNKTMNNIMCDALVSISLENESKLNIVFSEENVLDMLLRMHTRDCRLSYKLFKYIVEVLENNGTIDSITRCDKNTNLDINIDSRHSLILSKIGNQAQKHLIRDVYSRVNEYGPLLNTAFAFTMIGIYKSEAQLENNNYSLSQDIENAIDDTIKNVNSLITDVSKNTNKRIPSFGFHYGRHRMIHEMHQVLIQQKFYFNNNENSNNDDFTRDRIGDLILNWFYRFLNYVCNACNVCNSEKYRIVQCGKNRATKVANMVVRCLEGKLLRFNVENVEEIMEFLIECYKACWDKDEAKRVHLEKAVILLINSGVADKTNTSDALLTKATELFKNKTPDQSGSLFRAYKNIYDTHLQDYE